MENPIKMDDLGGKPTIFGNIHLGSGDFPPKNSSLQAPPTASVLYDVSHLKGPIVVQPGQLWSLKFRAFWEGGKMIDPQHLF